MNDAIFLDELASGLARRGAALAPESALFIVFEAVESLGGRAAVLSPSAVRVSGEGVVSLGPALDPAHDETSVLEGAVETLEAVLDPAPVGVVELAVKVRSAEIISRGALLSELAAMLVPLNRRAARRMIARLVRECARPASAPAVTSTSPSDSIGAAELLALTLSPEPVVEGASDTVLDAPTLGGAASTSLGGRLPDGWGDEQAVTSRRSSERRNAWVAMAVAAVALAAAVVFLVARVRAAGA